MVMGGYGDEFPLLSSLGLYAANIRGDGNCLFNALSDQIYGTQDRHQEVRSKVIDYMKEHGSFYKQFLDVTSGGGTRRTPKRKTTIAHSSPNVYTPPTAAEIDRVFEQHLQIMSKGGTWGDNMEIQAFSAAFSTDVKIYQRDFAYMIQAGEEDVSRPIAHIAYHLWEHYSSIRNTDGPHSGPPLVQPRALSHEEELKQRQKLEEDTAIQPWMIQTLQSSLPFLIDKSAAKRALRESKGNLNNAVSRLLDSEDGSGSSAQDTSSIEREPDSDDDKLHRPNKRRDRRVSRATRGESLLGETEIDCSTTPEGSQSSIESRETDNQSNISTEQINFKDVESEDKKSSIIKVNLLPPIISHSRSVSPRRTIRKVPARERKAMQKQAQKAARKERQKTTSNAMPEMDKGNIMTLRDRSMTQTPPIESGFRTLFI